MKTGKNRYFVAFTLLIVCIVLLLQLNICIGSVDISLAEVFRILTGKGLGNTNHDIVMQIRFPRAMACLLLGGALALSGYLLQTFFHNPIAGPFVLGISSGAKFVVALLMIFCLAHKMQISSFLMIFAAFIGAMLSMGFVLLLSKALHQMSLLIVGGIMIGYICSAVTDFMVTFAADSNIVNLHSWSQGSFSGLNWENVLVIAIVVLLTTILVFFQAKPMSAYQLGEAYAQNMGVNIPAFRVLLVILSSILSACVTAFAGPISFVGIAVPHLMKKLFGTAKPLFMIPACFLGGGAFCLFCDLIARCAFAPTELGISTVTAIFGAPVVIYMMCTRRKEKGDAR